MQDAERRMRLIRGENPDAGYQAADAELSRQESDPMRLDSVTDQARFERSQGRRIIGSYSDPNSGTAAYASLPGRGAQMPAPAPALRNPMQRAGYADSVAQAIENQATFDENRPRGRSAAELLATGNARAQGSFMSPMLRRQNAERDRLADRDKDRSAQAKLGHQQYVEPALIKEKTQAETEATRAGVARDVAREEGRTRERVAGITAAGGVEQARLRGEAAAQASAREAVQAGGEAARERLAFLDSQIADATTFLAEPLKTDANGEFIEGSDETARYEAMEEVKEWRTQRRALIEAMAGGNENGKGPAARAAPGAEKAQDFSGLAVAQGAELPGGITSVQGLVEAMMQDPQNQGISAEDIIKSLLKDGMISHNQE